MSSTKSMTFTSPLISPPLTKNHVGNLATPPNERLKIKILCNFCIITKFVLVIVLKYCSYFESIINRLCSPLTLNSVDLKFMTFNSAFFQRLFNGSRFNASTPKFLSFVNFKCPMFYWSSAIL